MPSERAFARFDTSWSAGHNRPRRAPEDGGRRHLNEKLHHMLRDLRRALSEAISESTEVSRTLRKIREEGYSLYLLVDCKREGVEGEHLALTPSAGQGQAAQVQSQGEPNFQINGRDLSFLRSIGIDPTRRLRRRRTI
jgi:hypothetical protein